MAGSGLRGLGLALLVGCVAAVAACGGGEDSDTVVIEPNEPVQIRTLLSLTGAPSLAEPTRYGIEMAVRDFHSVHGHEIELGELIDSMCSPEGGRAGAERVVADARVLGVVGTSCSGAAVAASPVLSEAGLVMISPSNTSPALTSDLAGNPGSDYHPGYFRVSNNDLYQARAVAGFAYNELGLRRIAAVHDGDAYTTAVVSAFGDAFGAVGGEVAATAEIEKGDTDMTAALTEFAAAGPDGIFLPLFLAEGSPFAAQAREFDGLEGATVIAGSAILVAEFLGEPQSEGVYFVGPQANLGSNVNVATGKSAAAALAAFETAYGGPPTSPYWAHAYDATTLLLAAIQRLAVRDDGNVLTRAIGVDEEGRLRIERSDLRQAIRDVSSDFQGITGRLSCDEFGDCAQGIQNIYHHTDTSVTDAAQLPVVYRFTP